MLDSVHMDYPVATESRAANMAVLAAYRRFRGALIGAAAMEDHLRGDAAWFDAEGVRAEGSLERIFARQAVEGTVAAMDEAMSALDTLEACLPRAVLDDPDTFEARIRAHVSIASRNVDAAIKEVIGAGGVAAFFAGIRRDLSARRDGYRMGHHLIASRDGRLADVFKLAEAIRRDPEVSPTGKLANPTDDPGPSAVILCLLGIAGAVACVIGLAVTIAVVNPSHGVE